MPIKDRIPSPEELIDSLPISREFLSRLGVLAGQTTRKLSIESLGISSGSLDDVEISKVTLGNASIGNLAIANGSARLTRSSAFLNNVRALVSLDFRLRWEIDLGWVGHWQDTSDLGDLDIPVELGNIEIPDLDDIELTIPRIDIPQLVADMKPITNLQLGSFSLSDADLSKLTAPSAGLNLTGLGVGEVSVSTLTVPGINSQTVTVAEAAPEQALKLPGASLNNLQIPQTSIPQIRSGHISTDATASPHSLGVDLGILKITLQVTPTVHLNVGTLTISDAQLSAELGSVELQDIQLPVAIQGITAKAFEANGLSVNQITF